MGVAGRRGTGELEEMWVKTLSILPFFCHNNRDCSFISESWELGVGREWGGVWFVDLVLDRCWSKGDEV